jgi:hypothetical protein
MGEVDAEEAALDSNGNTVGSLMVEIEGDLLP